jgi:hypothetical protein
VYFTVETVATVGFGDFSFSSQPTWVEAFGIGLIVAGTTLVTTRRAVVRGRGPGPRGAVAAIRRAAGPRGLEHPPRRDTTLAADEDAYLVGPYAELLEVLRHDREGEQAPVAGAP